MSLDFLLSLVNLCLVSQNVTILLGWRGIQRPMFQYVVTFHPSISFRNLILASQINTMFAVGIRREKSVGFCSPWC